MKKLMTGLMWICLCSCQKGPMVVSGGQHLALPIEQRLFPANDPRIQYVGRVDVSNPASPRCWAGGGYLITRFAGPNCRVLLTDQRLWKSHNYITVVLDEESPRRLQLQGDHDTILVQASGIGVDHQLVLCKETESAQGYLQFDGILANELRSAALPVRRMEFIGDSQTSGSAANTSEIACGAGQWYDQHDAYASFGARTARNLNAQWMLSSVAGIGLLHSKGDAPTMPQVWDKTSMYNNSIPWDFSRYTPDLVTICLGQNDGVADSARFCAAFIQFVRRVKTTYPNTKIVLMTSPMAYATDRAIWSRYLQSVASATGAALLTLSGQFNHGCAGHPNVSEHEQIAGQLTAFIKSTFGW